MPKLKVFDKTPAEMGFSFPPEWAPHTGTWFSWPRPDGQPVDNDSWSSPARMLSSMSNHYVMAGSWWPSAGIKYRGPRAWAGLTKRKKKIRFDVLVDRMSQELLHKRSTAALLEACCTAVGTRPSTKINKDHPVMQWDFPRLLTTFLDIRLKNGRTVSARVDAAKGSASLPMTEDEVARKFRECAEFAGCPGARADPIIDLVLHLEKLEDIRSLTRLLGAG